MKFTPALKIIYAVISINILMCVGSTTSQDAPEQEDSFEDLVYEYYTYMDPFLLQNTEIQDFSNNLDELSTETNAVQTDNNMDSQIEKVMDNVHKVIDGHADIDEQVLDDDQVLDDGQLLEDGQVLEDGQMDWNGGETEESLRIEEKIGEIPEPQYPTEPLYQSDDFGLTLSGMMAALTEIQTRGDNMLKAVRVQQRKLEDINNEISGLESEKSTLGGIVLKMQQEKNELHSEITNLVQERDSLSDEIEELGSEKDAVILEVENGHGHMKKMQTEMEPIMKQIKQRRLEIFNFDTQIRAKKEELERFNQKIISAKNSLSEKDVSVSVPAESTPAPLSVLLAVSVVGNLLLGSPYLLGAVSQVASRSDNLSPSIREGLINLSSGGFGASLLKKLKPVKYDTISQFTPSLKDKNREPGSLKKNKKVLRKRLSSLRYVTDRLEKFESRFGQKKTQNDPEELYYDLL